MDRVDSNHTKNYPESLTAHALTRQPSRLHKSKDQKRRGPRKKEKSTRRARCAKRREGKEKAEKGRQEKRKKRGEEKREAKLRVGKACGRHKREETTRGDA